MSIVELIETIPTKEQAHSQLSVDHLLSSVEVAQVPKSPNLCPSSFDNDNQVNILNVMLGATTSGNSSGAQMENQVSPPTLTQPSEPNLQREFVREQCLFCNKKSDEFESNLRHMQTSHGLFIPDRTHLIVELETLIEYIHLVIFGYNECICCGTQRHSAQAAQQHMVGKGHCRIDIADEESEFADFYDFSEAEDESQDESEEEEGSDTAGSKRDNKLDKSVQPDDNSLRLPSGKIISKSSSLQPHTQRPKARSRSADHQSHIEDAESTTAVEPDQARSSTSLITRASKGGVALTKSERQENAFTTQLARLSVNDRNSLAHLPASEQRALLATQQKQAEKTRQAERRYQSRVEGLGNKTLMKHFRPDNPGGRANG